MKVEVAKSKDWTRISGLPIQAAVTHLRNRFGVKGIRASIGILPGELGYHVLVYHRSIGEVKSLLNEFGMTIDELGAGDGRCD
jgi:hypothetical protein